MDLFGIGGPEFILILILAGVVLGPRRLAAMAREIGRFVDEIRTLARNLSRELNRDIDLLEAAERKSGRLPGSASPETQQDQQSIPGKVSEASLPEAYQRFRAEFPDEGNVDGLSGEAARDAGQRGRNEPT